jgi:lipoprotein-releasing system ATP-binding protein
MDSGTVRVGETDITTLPEQELTTFRNRHVGFVFQFHHLLPEFTALENVEMPLRIARMAPEPARARATVVLTRLGLGERLTHRPSMLSGGEQQRVAVARALVTEPSVLLADEPTGDLDEATAEGLHALLREMHRERQLSSVIATHNMQLAKSCDRILRLEAGRLVSA